MTEHFVFEGIQMLAEYASEESLSFARDEFLVRDDDVIIVTYPRSGTHWMINILSLIISEVDLNWVETVENCVRFPCLESKQNRKVFEDWDGPRLMTSHLPVQLFPKSYFSSRAKVIYVIRNPKDVATSLYHLRKLIPHLNKTLEFAEYLHHFIQGKVTFGSWFDHTLGWLKKRDSVSLLLISYEELQKDLKGCVYKICGFLGKKLEPEQIDSIVQNSSFQIMKENRLSNYISLRNALDDTIIKINMLRKGISGDWKNIFTVAQSEKMSDVDPCPFTLI